MPWAKRPTRSSSIIQRTRATGSSGAPDDPVSRIRWMVEELRVGLFAQVIGTPRPVSEQRVYKAIDQLIAS